MHRSNGEVARLAYIACCRSGRNLPPRQMPFLAEHYLAAHELGKVSPFSQALADKVRDLCRANGFPNATEELIASQFNRRDRFTQLNVIALALHHAGTAPLLPREFWRPSRNPFLAKMDPGEHSRSIG